MSPQLAQAVREALLQVAHNVAKHIIQRDGWTEDDECFQVDLCEAEEKLRQMLEAEIRPPPPKLIVPADYEAEAPKQHLIEFTVYERTMYLPISFEGDQSYSIWKAMGSPFWPSPVFDAADIPKFIRLTEAT